MLLYVGVRSRNARLDLDDAAITAGQRGSLSISGITQVVLTVGSDSIETPRPLLPRRRG